MKAGTVHVESLKISGITTLRLSPEHHAAMPSRAIFPGSYAFSLSFGSCASVEKVDERRYRDVGMKAALRTLSDEPSPRKPCRRQCCGEESRKG